MASWFQILQIVGNSTLIYVSFDTHDSPGAVFIYLDRNGKFLDLMSLCAIALKFICSEKGTKFCEISTLLLSDPM